MNDPMKNVLRLALAAVVATPAAAQFTFGGEISTRLGGRSVHLADLDGDGDADVVVGDSEGRVSWLRNLGGGAFSDVQRLGTFAEEVTEVQVGDVDGDGTLDIVALTDGSDPQVVLFPGLATGGFGPVVVQGDPNPAAPGFTRLKGSALGDIDGDGDLDLLNGGGPSGVRLQRNVGGSLLPAFTVVGSEWVLDLELADVDGDGDLDLVFLDDGPLSTTAVLRVALNGPGGTFGTPTVLWTTPNPGPTTGIPNLAAVKVGDVDGDGRPDVLASSGTGPSSGQRAVWCRNLGAGAFAAAVSLEATLPVAGIELLDVEGDGDADVVLVRDIISAGYELAVLRNGGGGTLGAAETLLPGAFATELDAADLDGDGFVDLMISGGTREPVWSRNPGGALPFELVRPVAVQAIGVGEVWAVDVDGDGRRDVVRRNAGDWPLIWSRGLGSGQFASFQILAPALAALEDPRGYHLEDVTGDGLVDVLALSDAQASFIESQLTLFPALATGGFGPGQVIADVLPGIARSLDVADVDGDGDKDIVIDAGPWALEGLGAGQFGPPVQLDLGTGSSFIAQEIVIEDLDGDRRSDLAVWDRLAGSVRFLRGLGGASFATGVELVPLTGFGPEVVGMDLDADGDRDLVWFRDSFVRAWVNDGAASAAPEQLVLPVTNVGTILAQDVDTDGDEDLFLERGGGSIGVGRLDGGIVTSLVLVTPDVPAGFAGNYAVLDADEDGAPDLLFSGGVNGSSEKLVGWLRSTIGPTVGERACLDAVPNSTGEAGVLFATGSAVLADNDLTLRGRSLPPGEFSLLLAARASGAPLSLSNSEGVLCLRGPIGRFNGPGEVFQTSGVGTWAMDVDLTALPTPSALVSAMAGETWHFQLYHRDRDGGPFRSNTTTTASVTF